MPKLVVNACVVLLLGAFVPSQTFAAPVLPLHNAHQGQGYLGIAVRDVTDDQLGTLRLREARGAEIIRVDHDAPAGKMGLHEHDVVLQLNGILIEGQEQLRKLLHDLAPGRAVALLISRDGQQQTMTAQMADRDQVDRQAWQQHLLVPNANAVVGDDAADTEADSGDPAPTPRYGKSFLGTLHMSPSYTGAVLEKMSPQLAGFFGVPPDTGLLVRSVSGNSPAAAAGLRAGDIIVGANAHAVKSVGDWARQVRDAKGRPLAITIMRDRQEKTLTLVPDGKRRSSLELPDPASQPLAVAAICTPGPML